MLLAPSQCNMDMRREFCKALFIKLSNCATLPSLSYDTKKAFCARGYGNVSSLADSERVSTEERPPQRGKAATAECVHGEKEALLRLAAAF